MEHFVEGERGIFDIDIDIDINIDIDIDIDIFGNCNWVATRWQQYSTHLHINSTQNDTKQMIHRTTQQFWKSAGRAPSWLVISWHLPSFIHSFSILSDDKSKASSKTIPPHSAIYSFLLQMRVSSPVLKVIQ